MNILKFKWDENKNISNQKKYGISFEKAKTVFSDELGRLILDPDHSEDELRFIFMGISYQHNLLTICHCERHSNIIRIDEETISYFKEMAEKKESPTRV